MNPILMDDEHLELETHSPFEKAALYYLARAFNAEIIYGDNDPYVDNSIRRAGRSLGYFGLTGDVNMARMLLKAEAEAQAARHAAEDKRTWARLLSIASRRQERARENEVVYGGYSRWALECAFRKVCDPADWKAALAGTVDEADLDVVCRAIEFYTATEPEIGPAFTPGRWHVYSIGYRAGPAGDH